MPLISFIVPTEPGVVSPLRSLPPSDEIEVLVADPSPSPSAGINRAAATATGQWLAITQSDTAGPADLIDRLRWILVPGQAYFAHMTADGSGGALILEKGAFEVLAGLDETLDGAGGGEFADLVRRAHAVGLPMTPLPEAALHRAPRPPRTDPSAETDRLYTAIKIKLIRAAGLPPTAGGGAATPERRLMHGRCAAAVADVFTGGKTESVVDVDLGDLSLAILGMKRTLSFKVSRTAG